MRILILGKDGQLGRELCHTLAPLGSITSAGRQQLDLSDTGAIRGYLQQAQPDWIVNAAAYTAVDKAEEERDMAFRINALAPQVLAEEAGRLGARLVHYSTDYVFDGKKKTPYTEQDQTCPLNVYGASKLEGEKAIAASGADYLIFRTSWVYSAQGKNFFLTMLRLEAQRSEISVVQDQIGAPTWSRSIAEATAQVLRFFQNPMEKGRVGSLGGIYNMTAGGSTSWFEFARTIMAELAPSVSVAPISSSDYKTAACRPKYSVLSGAKLKATFGVALPQWDDALRQMIRASGILPLGSRQVRGGGD